MLYYTQLVKKDKRGEKNLKETLSKIMENKEGIMSFIKQLFSNAKANEEENIDKMENIDEETKKELEKSNKHINEMMEKYKIENFETAQKEKIPKVKKVNIINKENHQKTEQTIEIEQDGEERE